MQARLEGGRRLAALLAVLVTLGVVLAACGGSGDGSSDSSSAKGARGVASSGDQRQAVDAGGRSVIRTANLEVEVPDPDRVAEAARKVAVEAGGFLAAGTADGEGTERTSQVTLRVPEDRFDAVLAEVSRLGTVKRRTIGSDDVTDKVVDLEGRLENAQTSAQRLRELLAQAADVQTIILLEENLTKRETDVETLSGQLQALDDEVTLSTIDVTFTAEQPDKDPSINRDLPGPLRALRSGGVALVNVLQVVLVVVAFVLPFAAVGLVFLLGYRVWRRRHPKTSRSTPAPGPNPGLWANPPPPGTWVPGGAAPPPSTTTPTSPGRFPPPPSAAPPTDEPDDTDPTAPGG